MHCSVQTLFFEDKRDELICHWLGSFQECSCPRITTCERCRRHCPGSNTGSPQKKKSLSLKDKKNSDPRGSFLAEGNELDLQKAIVSSNTKRSTDWAVVGFGWKKARRDTGKDERSIDLLERGDPGDIVKWLSLFVAEARTVKGSHYSPTLTQLLAGILSI